MQFNSLPLSALQFTSIDFISIHFHSINLSSFLLGRFPWRNVPWFGKDYHPEWTLTPFRMSGDSTAKSALPPIEVGKDNPPDWTLRPFRMSGDATAKPIFPPRLHPRRGKDRPSGIGEGKTSDEGKVREMKEGIGGTNQLFIVPL